jgi:hypothetical protein
MQGIPEFAALKEFPNEVTALASRSMQVGIIPIFTRRVHPSQNPYLTEHA